MNSESKVIKIENLTSFKSLKGILSSSPEIIISREVMDDTEKVAQNSPKGNW